MITINKKIDNVTFYDLISANQSEINNILDIVPQPAPFDRTPTSDAPEGQFTISDYETGEIHE